MADANSDDEFEKLLNDFISTQLEDVDLDKVSSVTKEAAINNVSDVEVPSLNKSHPTSEQDDDDELAALKEGEKALFKAYHNFKDAIDMMAEENKLPPIAFRVQPDKLVPHYKPSVGKLIAEDTLAGWDVMIQCDPDTFVQIRHDMTDEQLLDFAEKTNDDVVQFALISYVEILIEMEGCEISYKERKLKREKKKLERKIYEDHQRRIELINRYIKAVQEKNFPIDAERLVKNYFKTAKKDPDGAYKVLTQNPAVYAPIQVDKIKPRFFGLLKVKPQDGIRMNKLIGEFLKKLKT